MFHSAALPDRWCLFNAEQVLQTAHVWSDWLTLPHAPLPRALILPGAFLDALSADTPWTQGVKVHFAAPSVRPPNSSLILFPFVVYDCTAPVTHNPK